MALLQSITLEMFAGKDAEPLYTEKGQFIVNSLPVGRAARKKSSGSNALSGEISQPRTNLLLKSWAGWLRMCMIT